MGMAEQKYVSFTTYRRSGGPVSTAVWIAPLGSGRTGFTTGASTGKAKRLAHTSQVLLRPCDRAGKVAPEAPEVTGQARVALPGDPVFEQVKQALRRSTGWSSSPGGGDQSDFPGAAEESAGHARRGRHRAGRLTRRGRPGSDPAAG